MRENIGQINWEEINAAQYPNWIRELGSDDPKWRLAAYDSLVNALVPWAITDPGMYWDSIVEPIQQSALPLVIPFLIELLTKDNIKDKARILWLLHEIASYYEIPLLVPEKERDGYMKHALILLKAVSEGKGIYTALSEADTNNEDQSFARGLLQLLDKLDTKDKDGL